MDIQTLAIITLLGSFAIMIFLRFPIAYAVGLSSVFCLLVQDKSLMDVCRLMVKGISSFSLMAVPFFITMGVLMGSGGISEKLIALANSCVGWMRGGLAQVNIVASYFFGGISGSASADTASLGSLLIPMMVDEGYDADFSTAVTITSSCEGLLVPPSHNMVIYATTAGGISVGSLFLAGYLPAGVLALSLMIGSYIISVKRHYPKGEKFSLVRLVKQLATSIWALAAILIVVVGVVGGLFTATESAAIAVIYSLIVSVFIYKGLNWKGVTEKGYALKDIHGNFFPFVLADFENGPKKCGHAMCTVTALLYERFKANAAPLAVVSMDNCSHNGEKLRSSIMTVVEKWLEKGFVTAEFAAWVSDEEKVSFPWSMIDKITPRPAKVVEDALNAAGIADMAPVITSKNTFIAPFVNAEKPQYLVVEDRFPNGRPPLEKAGVYLTDRDTVNNTEKMKVTTCLNPLHTALAVYGCMLGYESIAAEMKDAALTKLVSGIGYTEGLPVVVDPKILSPKAFIDEVVEQRLPNPFIPDTPQRIATDTSQKIPIRFGETIKSYLSLPDGNAAQLKYVPLALAGWLRYLLAVDDKGEPMQCSSDPMLDTLQTQLASVKLGQPETATEEVLKPILSNQALFAVDLYEAGLAGKVTDYFRRMLAGPGAVRATLEALV